MPTRKSSGSVKRINSYTDKAHTGEVMQVFFIDVLGQQTTRQNTDCGSDDQRGRGGEEYGITTDILVRGKQHGDELGFITQLGDKYGSVYNLKGSVM